MMGRQSGDQSNGCFTFLNPRTTSFRRAICCSRINPVVTRIRGELRGKLAAVLQRDRPTID